jgi:hypothetical protein
MRDRILGPWGRTGRGGRPNHLLSARYDEKAYILDCARLLTAPASVTISASATSGRPWSGRSGQLVAATTPCRLDPRRWPSSAMPRSASDRLSGLVLLVGERSLWRRRIGVPGRRRRLVPIRHPGLAIGRRVGTRARAVRRRALRVPTLPATAADYHRRSRRWTRVVDRISSRRTLSVVVELVHRVATHFTHGRPPPLRRGVLTRHTKEQWPCHPHGPGGHSEQADTPGHSVSRQAEDRDGRHLRPREWIRPWPSTGVEIVDRSP